jgi:hypothetical protein
MSAWATSSMEVPVVGEGPWGDGVGWVEHSHGGDQLRRLCGRFCGVGFCSVGCCIRAGWCGRELTLHPCSHLGRGVPDPLRVGVGVDPARGSPPLGAPALVVDDEQRRGLPSVGADLGAALGLGDPQRGRLAAQHLAAAAQRSNDGIGIERRQVGPSLHAELVDEHLRPARADALDGCQVVCHGAPSGPEAAGTRRARGLWAAAQSSVSVWPA